MNPQEKGLPYTGQVGAVIALLQLEAALGMTYVPAQGRVSPTGLWTGVYQPTLWQFS